jgi:HK97 family phage portal protein
MAEAENIADQQAAGQAIDQEHHSVYHVQTMPFSFAGEYLHDNDAGVEVTETSVLRSIPAMSAVLVIAEAMGSLPIQVYRRLSPYGKERATDHPLYEMLHSIPNPDITAQGWVETMMLHALLWGNAYSAIGRDEMGRPEGLYPLLPDRTAPIRSNEDGQLVYATRAGDKVYYILPADIFHVMGPSLSGWLGINRVQKCRNALASHIAADKHAASAYGQGVNPSGLISHPKGIGPRAAENLRQDVERQHQGLSNFFKTIVLQEGAEFKPFEVDLNKKQLLEARKFSVQEAGRLWRVPPILLNDTETSNYSIGEQMMRHFITMTLRPWGKRFRMETHRKLLREDEKDTYFAEFLYEDLLTGDFSAKASYYQTLQGLGAITPSEIRERENLNPFEGDLGTEPVVNQAVIPLRQVGQQRSASGGESDPAGGAGSRGEARDKPADDDELRGTPYSLDAWHTVTELASKFDVDRERLRQRLNRWRENNPEAPGWIELNSSGPTAPKYMYRVRDVMPILRALRAAMADTA